MLIQNKKMLLAQNPLISSDEITTITLWLIQKKEEYENGAKIG